MGYSCIGIQYGCTDPAANNYNVESTIDDNTCEYNEYIEPSISRLWKFLSGESDIPQNILNDMQNFVAEGCNSYECPNPIPFIGDTSNLYYGELIDASENDIIFAFVNETFRGASFVKTIKNIRYIYLEVKFIQSTESGTSIDFYSYINGQYYSIILIDKYPYSEYIPPSEITSTFGLL